MTLKQQLVLTDFELKPWPLDRYIFTPTLSVC